MYGNKKKRADEAEQKFDDELGDILYTLICFANSHKIKLDSAIKKSMAKVMRRDKKRFNQFSSLSS